MQFIALLFLFSFSVFAKSDYCSFSSDFADKYMQARKNYADRIKEFRHDNPHSKNSSGKIRAKLDGDNWPEASLKKTVNKLFHTLDIDIKVKANGKMLIYPKNVRPGQPIILFDPSGDYFRIVKSESRNGMIVDTYNYFDINGKPLIEPSPKDRKAFNEYGSKTHFQAKP